MQRQPFVWWRHAVVTGAELFCACDVSCLQVEMCHHQTFLRTVERRLQWGLSCSCHAWTTGHLPADEINTGLYIATTVSKYSQATPQPVMMQCVPLANSKSGGGRQTGLTAGLHDTGVVSRINAMSLSNVSRLKLSWMMTSATEWAIRPGSTARRSWAPVSTSQLLATGSLQFQNSVSVSELSCNMTIVTNISRVFVTASNFTAARDQAKLHNHNHSGIK